ncbi:ABC transporter permease [Chloroflexota bacterium]
MAKPTSSNKSQGIRLIRSTVDATKKWHAVVISILIFIIVVGVWTWLTRPGGPVHEIILPRPLDIVNEIGYLLSQSFFWPNAFTTIKEIAVGWAFAVLVGIIFGALVAEIPAARTILYPYIILFQAMPKVAFIPMFMVWFGFGSSSKIIVAAVVSFFPTFMNTLVGLSQTPEDGQRLMHSLGGSTLQRFWMLKLPAALPSIITGINITLTFAIIGVVVAEFQGSHSGLGYLIEVFTFQLRIARSFAVVIILSTLAFVIYALTEWLGQRFVFWANAKNKTGV